MKILLVEDNERVTQFVIKGLQEAGHTTDHAANGRDGMFLAASEPYDVIIMDRMLPGDIDGFAAGAGFGGAGGVWRGFTGAVWAAGGAFCDKSGPMIL